MTRRFVAIAICAALVAPAGARAIGFVPLTSYVDPMIGTLGAGFVFPGPAAPYGMVQLSPDTNGYFAYTGYQYADAKIRGFSHVHTQSMGVPEGGEIPFMPITGALDTDVRAYEQPFSHLLEEAEPGYYAVTLANRVRAELTAGTRVGLHRYTFPRDADATIVIDAGRSIDDGDPDQNLDRPIAYRPAEVHISGGDTVTGSVAGRNYPVHFAARFDRAFSSSGVWTSTGSTPQEGVNDAAGTGAGAFVRFSFDPYDDAPIVDVKVGISFVSRANALENLDREAGDRTFEQVRADTRAAWEDALGSIVVDGGTDAQKRSFYTALYHAQHHPNVFNDVNGQYLGYDNAVHSIDDAPMNGRPYYANYSFWDTYRAEMPLLMMIAPERVRDMMRSLAAVAQQGGRIPRWGWMNRYADFMNGEPGINSVADAWCRGLVPSDVKDTLYGDMRGLALTTRHRNYEFVSKGYTVGDASATLEHAGAAFALALVADARGNIGDRDMLLDLAGNWRNILDPGSKFMRPRNTDGSWFTNGPHGEYHPELPDRWKEGTGWQYTWLVSHDARGLLEEIGVERARERLATFFAGATSAPYAGPEAQQKLTAYGIAYYGNQYAPSNEHDLQAPWIYAWAGDALKLQQLQRNLQTLYRDTPDGLPGNDDLGTMSAWFVWSALGFYPVTPGSPTYTIGSPMFPSARVRVPGGTFRVEASGAEFGGPFVARASVDGVNTNASWFPHAVIAPGRVVRLEMSALPQTSLESLPPSQSTNPLSDFACAG